MGGRVTFVSDCVGELLFLLLLLLLLLFGLLLELLFLILFARIAVGGGASCLAMAEEVQVIQLNMNQSNLAAVSLNERLKTLKSKYICLLTEPFRYKDKLASMPQRCYVVPDINTVKDPRASIISNLELVEISSLCTKDSAVSIIKHRGGK